VVGPSRSGWLQLIGVCYENGGALADSYDGILTASICTQYTVVLPILRGRHFGNRATGLQAVSLELPRTTAMPERQFGEARPGWSQFMDERLLSFQPFEEVHPELVRRSGLIQFQRMVSDSAGNVRLIRAIHST
jgi:hypothetical protein